MKQPIRFERECQLGPHQACAGKVMLPFSSFDAEASASLSQKSGPNRFNRAPVDMPLVSLESWRALLLPRPALGADDVGCVCV